MAGLKTLFGYLREVITVAVRFAKATLSNGRYSSSFFLQVASFDTKLSLKVDFHHTGVMRSRGFCNEHALDADGCRNTSQKNVNDSEAGVVCS